MQDINEFVSFEDYMRDTRNKFVQKILAHKWNIDLRITAEDILIAYDQMMDKILNASSNVNKNGRITVASMREILRKFDKEEITFSRMVEMLNEEAGIDTSPIECPTCSNVPRTIIKLGQRVEISKDNHDYRAFLVRDAGGGKLYLVPEFVITNEEGKQPSRDLWIRTMGNPYQKKCKDCKKIIIHPRLAPK